MRLFAFASALLGLALVAAPAGAEESQTGVPASVSHAVARFVNVKGQPTEKAMKDFSRFLDALPRAEKGCNAHPLARAAVAADIQTEAKSQIHHVLFVEKGELRLYKLARKISSRRIRRHYVLALDQVGNWLDSQLDDAKNDRKLGVEVGHSCGALQFGHGAAEDWTLTTEKVEEFLGRLMLAYGV